MQSTSQRKYDVIVFGATGFTGELVAEYLSTHYSGSQKKLSWAVAGRNKQKLEQLCTSLKLSVDSLVASIDDPNSLVGTFSQATVVIACAGPFAKIGTPVVDACIKSGTHYVDITGEFHWIKEIIDKYDEEAKKNKLLIVPACGFDSVPSDLGTYFTVTSAREKLRSECTSVTNYVSISSGFSSGTAHSAMALMSDPRAVALQKDLYALNPPGKKTGSDRFPRFKYDKIAKCWTVPFLMESVNSRVVRRSAALLDYGNNFRYEEVSKVSFLFGLISTLIVPIFMFLLSFAVIQRIISPLIPTGPSKETMSKGFISLKFVSQLDNKPQKTFETKFNLKSDAYRATALFVVESALSIVYHRNELFPAGGVLTPAVAMGDVLLTRLKNAGVQIVTEDEYNTNKKNQ